MFFNIELHCFAYLGNQPQIYFLSFNFSCNVWNPGHKVECSYRLLPSWSSNKSCFNSKHGGISLYLLFFGTKKNWRLGTWILRRWLIRWGFITSYMQKAPTSTNLVNKLCYVICYICYYWSVLHVLELQDVSQNLNIKILWHLYLRVGMDMTQRELAELQQHLGFPSLLGPFWLSELNVG